MSHGLSSKNKNTDFVATMKRIRNQALSKLTYLIYWHVGVFMSKAYKMKTSVIGTICLPLLGKKEDYVMPETRTGPI